VPKLHNWFTVDRLLWAIYLALLAVLLPHTAWAFGQFEPAGWAWLGWVAAIAFEGAIAAFTWRLKETIEQTPRHRSPWLRFRRRYLNVYSLGLAVAIAISAAANWAHSVEFGRPFAVFGRYAVPPLAYSVAFGAILPLCSLLFARILADVGETEHEADEALVAAKRTIGELRSALQATEQRLRSTEADRDAAELRFAAAGDLFARVLAGPKRERIRAAAAEWPALPASAIAVITEASPSYVSEVLREGEIDHGD